MNADYVEKIIRNIDEEFYTYKCILVDGTWGIGKSYIPKTEIIVAKKTGYKILWRNKKTKLNLEFQITHST